MAKIIDFEKKGNVVRFYLGADDLADYGGDDWNDAPYEHNAGTVYSEYACGICDIAFPYKYQVLEPSEDYTFEGNSPYCKDDMKARRVPCIIAIPISDDDYYWRYENCFNFVLADARTVKFYFGDKMDPSDKLEVYEG